MKPVSLSYLDAVHLVADCGAYGIDPQHVQLYEQLLDELDKAKATELFEKAGMPKIRRGEAYADILAVIIRSQHGLAIN